MSQTAPDHTDPRADAPPTRGRFTAELRGAEQQGIRLALIGRFIVLAPLAVWYGGIGTFNVDFVGIAGVGLFAIPGILHYILIVRGWERPWHRYAFLTVDAAGIAVIASLIPLSTGDDIPQILIFRVHGAYFLFLLPAIAALSLSPGLVLYAGAAATAALWGSFSWVVMGMTRTVSWGDLPAGADQATYLRVFLDPDFIGTGNRIEESIAILLTASLLALAVRRARRLVLDRAAANRQRAQIRSLFGQYVPGEVVNSLLETPEALAPQTREASVLICDIEGFTGLSETRDPTAVIPILNGFFETATGVIARHQGVVVSFAGDAVLAVFNSPVPVVDHPAQAVRAARGLVAATERETFSGHRLRIRVGVASGPVASGTVGGQRRQSWTVYGDTVNVAQRLEQLNKQLGTRVLVSDTVASAVKDVTWADKGEHSLRGRAAPMAVFAPEP